MKRLLVLIPVVVVFAVALAACGSGSGSSSVPSLGGGSHSQTAAAPGSLAAARTAVTCVRKHGMPNVPDPVVGSDGQISVPGYTTADLTPAARSACAAQIRAAEATASALPNLSSSDMQALLRWAACMRAHGFPHWPDPNPQGVFYESGHDGTQVMHQRADAACRSLRGSSLARVTAGAGGY
jgi:hypothetical protein